MVCNDCLTKKQIDHLFLLALQAEREAKARGLDIQAEDMMADLTKNALDPQDLTRPGLNSSASDSVAEAAARSEVVGITLTQRSQSFNNDGGNGNGGGSGGYAGFGAGWRGTKTDSGHGHIERLCDPCYLGLSTDQVKVLESGGGWQYYQATLGKHKAPGLAAALALSSMSLEDDADDNNDRLTEEQ